MTLLKIARLGHPVLLARAAPVVDVRDPAIQTLITDMVETLADVRGRGLAAPQVYRGLRLLIALRLDLETEREKVLALPPLVLANPQLAVVLMMIGFYGLFVEFTSPGFGVPGVAGAICLLLALYAFQMLPINWAGVALIALGLTLMVAEVFLPSFGVLGIGGIVAFVLGGLFLLDRELPGMALSLPFLAGTAAAAAGLIFLAGTLLVKSRGRPLASGTPTLLGATGEVTACEAATCWARVHGEQWRVRCAARLVPGMAVRVTAIDGLILSVEPIDFRSPT